MSFGASIEFRRNMGITAERTAIRGTSGHGVTFDTWSTRQAMAKAIRKQQQRVPHYTDWKALVPLKDGEGY